MQTAQPAGRGDSGSISALVVCLVTVFVACAGLVLDGGRFIGARARAAAVAAGAARDGVQEVHRLREGLIVVDVDRATRKAERFVQGSGLSGSATADERSVTVAVTTSVRPLLLGLVGVGTRTVTVSRTATPFDQ